MLNHLSPECGCSKEVQELSKHSSSTSTLPSVSNKCRSALTHFAWGAGCHSMVNLYHTTCTRYIQKKSKLKDSKLKSKNTSKNIPTLIEIAMFLTNKMPSFNRACNYLSQF